MYLYVKNEGGNTVATHRQQCYQRVQVDALFLRFVQDEQKIQDNDFVVLKAGPEKGWKKV